MVVGELVNIGTELLQVVWECICMFECVQVSKSLDYSKVRR